MNYWWKAHHGISNDTKLALAAIRSKSRKCEVGWVWIILLDFASQNEPRGSITGVEIDQIALLSELSEEKVLTIIDALKFKGLILENGAISSWEKQSYAGPNSNAERQRRYREKQKQRDEALRNAKNNVTRNANNVTNSTKASQNNAFVESNAPDQIRTEQIRSSVKSTSDLLNTETHMLPAQNGNGWHAFREAYAQTGKELIESDFDARNHGPKCFCAKCEWEKLDITDQIAAVKGIRARIDAGTYSTGEFWPKPQKYLTSREWERKLKSRGTKTETESLAERISKL